MSRQKKNIVIIGAGVSGLTTALLLSSSKDAKYSITIAAKHMPGDYDIEYASPWAGADYMPVSKAGTQMAEWDKRTWPWLRGLAEAKKEAGVHFQKTVIYNRKKDTPKRWWFDMMPDLRELPKSELKPDVESAYSFTSVCINTAIYLPYLVSACLANGVVFRRTIFDHVLDAAAEGVHASGSRADLVVNCTGLSAARLGGVDDGALFPIRGQIVLVRNNPGGIFSISDTDDGPEESCYIMTRAVGGGTVLGGCTQRGQWDSQVDMDLAVRIMTRAVGLCPALTQGKGIEGLDIVRHGVGLRPAREGGVRIGRERIGGVWVVHNYGHGGAGYQCSYGCAEAAVKEVEEALEFERPRL